MLRLPNVHPSDTTKWPNGTGTFDVGAANDGSKILMYNETPLNIDLDFLNGTTDTLHAWEATFWVLDADTKQIQWAIDADSLSVSTPPINAVFLTLYDPNEKLNGQYPVSLVRTVGGNVTTQQSQTLDNTGNATGSNVVTVSSTAATGNSWDVTNDGLWDIAVTIAGALTKVFKTFEPGAGGTILQLGAATYLAEVLGNLKVDGTLESVGAFTADSTASITGKLTASANMDVIGTLNAATTLLIGAAGVLAHLKGNMTLDGNMIVTGTSSLDATHITTDGSGNLTAVSLQSASVNSPSASLNIGAPTGDRINFVINGVVIAYIDGTGFHFSSSTSSLQWRTGGSVARWDSMNFTAPTQTYPGSFTVTHNFGYVPDSAWVQPGTSANLTGSCTTGVWDWLANTCVITLGAQINGVLWYKKNS